MGRRLCKEVCCLCGRDIKESDGDCGRKREKNKVKVYSSIPMISLA
jgi:hypothetical protein